MRKTFVWLLTTTGKMPVARMVKMNISGIKQSINCMVLAKVLLAAAVQPKKQPQQKLQQAKKRQQILRLVLLLIATAQQQRNLLLKNKIGFLEKVSAFTSGYFFVFKHKNHKLYTVLYAFVFAIFLSTKIFQKSIHNYIVFLMATNLSTLLLSYHINHKNSGRKQKVSKQGTAADKLFVVLAFLI